MAETHIGLGIEETEKVVDPKIKELESKLADEISAKERLLAEKVQFEKDMNALKDELESKLADEISAKESLLAEKVQLEKDMKTMKSELDKANKTIEELSNKQGGSTGGTDPKGSDGGSKKSKA